MVCEKCKNTLPDDSEFCQFCGNRVILACTIPKADSVPAASPDDGLPNEDVVEKMIAEGTQDSFLDRSSGANRKKERNPKTKKIAIVLVSIILTLAILGAGGYFLATCVIIPAQQYAAAEELYGKGDFVAAETAFTELGDYSDAPERVLECRDGQAITYVDNAKYNDLNTHIRAYGLSVPLQEHISSTALNAIAQGDYATAHSLVPMLSSAPNVQDGVKEALYQEALTHYNKGEYVVSNDLFEYLGTYKDSKQKIHAHNYTVKAETAATCDKDGASEYVCSCGATESKPIKATGHDYSVATCKQPATCKVCGKTNGTTLNHNYSTATCTKAKTCSVCGKTDGSALGHSLVDSVCSRCGKVEISLSQLQGTWVRGAGHYKIIISGSTATVHWYGSYTGEMVYTGAVQLKDYGFYVEGTYQDVDINGNPFTAKTSTRCYISKFTSTYFIDTFDDNGPYTWYKQ